MESLPSKIRTRRVIDEPRWVKSLFTRPAAAWFWLAPRLLIGWAFVRSGEAKLVDPDWIRTGVALQTQWQHYLSHAGTSQTAISFDWYRLVVHQLLSTRAYTWLAPLVAWGEVAIGVGLVVGAFTGIAAFLGAFTRWNFMMAGSATADPILFVIAIGLILAWRVAGYVGLDYFLLPWLGTPWSRRMVDVRAQVQSTSARNRHLGEPR